MITQLLKDILSHEIDCGATIVTINKELPHISNTWNSYIQIIDEETLHIPVGGMIQTEKNLIANNNIKLSITNRVIKGFNYPGTGVVVEGTGQMISNAEIINKMKEIYPWIRAVLEVKVSKSIQTL